MKQLKQRVGRIRPGIHRPWEIRVSRKLPVRYIHVTDVRLITPHMKRVTFGGADLADLVCDGPDQQVKLYFPKPGQVRPRLPEPGPDGDPASWYQAYTAIPEAERPWMRSYTIRAHDPHGRTIDVDFVLHDDAGPATRWAMAARPGDVLGMFGPSADYARPVPVTASIAAADWLLLAGDETALPAIGTLVEALPAGTIRQGVVCTHVVEQDNGAVLHFRDGTTVTADLVIGADGIHSVVRRGLIADTPIFSGFTVYRGLVPIDRVPHLFDRPQVLFWLGPGGHVTSYPIVSRQLIHFSAVIASPDWDPKVWSAPGQVADAVAAFQGWTDTVRDLIGAADTVTRWALFDREPTGRWHGQRTVLVGDAAHPMLPFMSQGANQAIEDAATLVTLLVRAGLERDAALQAYQTLRQPRVAEVHRHARIRGRTFHFQDGEQQRQRDAAMPKTEDIGSYEWLYGFDAEQLPLDRAGAVSESPLRR